MLKPTETSLHGKHSDQCEFKTYYTIFLAIISKIFTHYLYFWYKNSQGYNGNEQSCVQFVDEKFSWERNQKNKFDITMFWSGIIIPSQNVWIEFWLISLWLTQCNQTHKTKNWLESTELSISEMNEWLNGFLSHNEILHRLSLTYIASRLKQLQ